MLVPISHLQICSNICKIYIKMLNFIFNRPQEGFQRGGGVSRNPSRTFGVSIQSPPEFSNQHTMIQPGSYVNPHLKYEENRLSKMSDHQKSQVEAEWTKKSNINLLQEEKVINLHKIQNQAQKTLYHDNHQRQLKKNTTRFRLTKGQFTQFIQSQHKNQVFGPLEGQERTLERARQTRKSILQNSLSSLQKMKSDASNMSVYRTSTLWKEKGKLRKSRQQLHSSFKTDLQSRRYHKSPQFELPRVIKKPYITERNVNKSLYGSNFNTIDLSRLSAYRI